MAASVVAWAVINNGANKVSSAKIVFIFHLIFSKTILPIRKELGKIKKKSIFMLCYFFCYELVK
jgi:hypothetical protein